MTPPIRGGGIINGTPKIGGARDSRCPTDGGRGFPLKIPLPMSDITLNLVVLRHNVWAGEPQNLENAVAPPLEMVAWLTTRKMPLSKCYPAECGRSRSNVRAYEPWSCTVSEINGYFSKKKSQIFPHAVYLTRTHRVFLLDLDNTEWPQE